MAHIRDSENETQAGTGRVTAAVAVEPQAVASNWLESIDLEGGEWSEPTIGLAARLRNDDNESPFNINPKVSQLKLDEHRAVIKLDFSGVPNDKTPVTIVSALWNSVRLQGNDHLVIGQPTSDPSGNEDIYYLLIDPKPIIEEETV